MILMGKVTRHAHRTGLIQTNPMFAIQIPPIPQFKEPRFLSPAEVETLAQAIEQPAWAKTYGDLVRFAAWTGLRAGEIVGLRVGDVDLKRGVVKVRRTVRKVSGGWESTTPKSQRSTREVPRPPTSLGFSRATWRLTLGSLSRQRRCSLARCFVATVRASPTGTSHTTMRSSCAGAFSRL